MIADTNGKRTHTFSGPRPHHECKPIEPTASLISCGGIGTVWGSSPPKQPLFHCNLSRGPATRPHESCAGSRVPVWGLRTGWTFRKKPQSESVSQIGTSERDAVSARGVNRKAYPGLRANSGSQFPPRASNGNRSPQFGRKVGCGFPGLDKERRQRLLAYSPRRAFSGVIGSERTWWPVACATAEATAASGVLMTTSPIDLAPNGPVGS